MEMGKKENKREEEEEEEGEGETLLGHLVNSTDGMSSLYAHY